MRLLIGLLPAAQPANEGGVDPRVVVAIPAAAVAAVTLALYLIGVIRPLAVLRPRYWHEGNVTRFSCFVKNRSRLYDKQVTALVVVRPPSGFDRVFSRWRELDQVPTVIPWGETIAQIRDEGLSITKNNAVQVFAELRDGKGEEGQLTVPAELRLEARAANKRSRSRRIEGRRSPPAKS